MRNIARSLLGRQGFPTPLGNVTPEPHRSAENEERRKIWETVQPYTMVPEPAIDFLIDQVITLLTSRVSGVLVECGVWRGGSSMAMLLAQQAAFGRVERPVYMLDSFQGLPPVTAKDGPLASKWQQGADPENFLDNCRAVREEVDHALARMGFVPGDYTIVEGWFDQTVPRLAEDISPNSIALLRLDGDWYDSTRCCLDTLMPLVSEGGVVIIDDYYAWDGCARAVHDYLSSHDVAYRIRSLPQWYGAYFIKKAARDRFDVL
ncbi:MAG TPA: TylF/MycF/NovP-related O-methyltransferase [Nitrospira sp.]|nr:TylF/MycF/NovP-related O-methyltransferase [Nitrospira sp.]